MLCESSATTLENRDAFCRYMIASQYKRLLNLSSKAGYCIMGAFYIYRHLYNMLLIILPRYKCIYIYIYKNI